MFEDASADCRRGRLTHPRDKARHRNRFMQRLTPAPRAVSYYSVWTAAARGRVASVPGVVAPGGEGT